jgi:hypothetical protein
MDQYRIRHYSTNVAPVQGGPPASGGANDVGVSGGSSPLGTAGSGTGSAAPASTRDGAGGQNAINKTA